MEVRGYESAIFVAAWNALCDAMWFVAVDSSEIEAKLAQLVVAEVVLLDSVRVFGSEHASLLLLPLGSCIFWPSHWRLAERSAYLAHSSVDLMAFHNLLKQVSVAAPCPTRLTLPEYLVYTRDRCTSHIQSFSAWTMSLQCLAGRLLTGDVEGCIVAALH